MAFVIIAHDAPDSLERRMAVRPRHLEVIEAWARDGRLVLAGPLLTADGMPRGSIMVLDVPDQAGVRDYLAAEPFATGSVWEEVEVHPFRIAPLPYRPLPGAPGAANAITGEPATPPPPLYGFAVIARDGTDERAQDRRLAARPRHFARVESHARDGRLVMGGAILDAPEGRMIGSVAVLALPDEAAARAWLAEDPYVTEQVWHDIALHPFRVAPLPYRPLPGA